MDIATQHIRVVGDANLATRTIQNGEPIMICGLVVQGHWKATYTHHFTDADGNVILTVETGDWLTDLDSRTVTIGASWIAENGFIAPASNATYTTTVLFRPFI